MKAFRLAAVLTAGVITSANLPGSIPEPVNPASPPTSPLTNGVVMDAAYTGSVSGPHDVTPNAGPDLRPYAHTGWSQPIVASIVTGDTVDAVEITDEDTIYLDWAVANFGDADSGPFTARILLDGQLLVNGGTDGIGSFIFTWWEDFAFGPLAPGTYTLTLIADADNEVVESDETNNTFTRDLVVVEAIPAPDLVPSGDLPGWSDAIVVSNVAGGTTDTAVDITDTIYLDWTVLNAGNASAGAYETRILLNGSEVLVGPSLGVDPGVYESWLDRTIGPLSGGPQLLTLEVDYLGNVTESEEGNNAYSRSFFVDGPPEIRIDPTDVTVEIVPPAVLNPVPMTTVGGGEAVLKSSPTGWNLDEGYISMMESAPIPEAGKLRQAELITADLADGLAHVIVTMRPAIRRMATMDWSSESARAALRSENVAMQEAVLAGVPGTVEIEHTYENFGGFSGIFDQAALDALMADPDVYAIEPVLYAQKHDLQAHPQMGADVYFDTYDGTGITVAICDDGVDYNHPELGGGPIPNAKVIGGYDFADNDADPFSALNNHGTACAGIAAGDPPAGAAGDYIGGVAKNAKIVALKVFSDGSGSASFADIIASWDWSVTNQFLDPANPIMVISNSLGGGRFTSAAGADSAIPSMVTAVNTAISAGITILASSGNDGFCDAMGAPAALSNIISVGAVYDADIGTPGWCVDATSCGPIQATGGCSSGWVAIETSTAQDQVTLYSNSADFLDIFAPSNNAYTTDIVGAPGYDAGNYTPSFGGTSAACPYAAGAVASLQRAAFLRTGAYLTPAEVLAILTATGDPITDDKVPTITKPRVNLAAAIESLPQGNIGSFTIYNDGFSDLTISSIVPETVAPWLSVDPAPPFSIPALSSKEVLVLVDDTLAPEGTTVTRLLVGSNDADEDPYPGAVFVTVINGDSGLPELTLKTELNGDTLTVSWDDDPDFDPSLTYTLWRSTNGGFNPGDFSIASGPLEGMTSSGFLKPGPGSVHVFRLEVSETVP